MKVVIVGSGLIGITAAYLLRHQGHEVTVVDRAQGPALETSFANGALLTPCMSEPWNAPGCWRVLLASLGRSDAALQLRLRTLPSLSRWGIEFLRNSRPANFERNTLSNMRLALYSLEVMHSLRQQTHIEYGRKARGSLKIFRTLAALERAAAIAQGRAQNGITFKVLSLAATVALEPGLKAIEQELAGALHYQVDETGDAYKFCVAMTDAARKQGVEFCFNTEVTALNVHSGRVTGIMAGGKRLEADHYLIAAGSYSTPLLARAGVRLPVRPAKGYSVTFPVPPGQTVLSIPLIDDDLHAAVVPLEGALRVAGTAEFAGFDLSLNPARISNLVKLQQTVLPRANLDPQLAKAWCALRPMSADGVPIIGGTPLANLWVSSGHGHLGWTMAAGSAQLLADLMSGQRTAIAAAPYALERFGR